MPDDARGQARRPRRAVSGILLLDKPPGLSSNRALQRARQCFGAAKAGHAGTLDPMATGLLPVCLGEATKIAGRLLGGRKAYQATCRLGINTDTDDSEGEVLRTRPVPDLDAAGIESVLARFRGRIRQVPPVYSALKQDGVPLYRRARRGEAVTAPEREVEIHRLEHTGGAGADLELDVECGSGTYVRSLARDIGEALGCGAHLVALRRTWVEPFAAPRMYTLEELALRAEEGIGALDACLLPLEAGLAGLPRLDLDGDASRRLRHGQAVRLRHPPGEALAVDPQGVAVALVEVAAGGQVRVVRGFAEPSGA